MRYIGKKGVQTISYFIFVITIAVVSLVVLLYFVLRVDFKEFSVDETCQLSVLSRAITPDYGKKAINIPLKCSTRETCVTDSVFGKCEEQFADGEAERLRISGEPEKAAKIIEKSVADSMLSCWKMMGEGRVDLLGDTLPLEKAEPVCVICSRIAFDEDFKSGMRFKEIIEEVDINDFLEENQAPQSKESYLSIFTDGAVSTYDSFENEIDKTENAKDYGTDDIAILFAQINTEGDSLGKAFDSALIGVGAIIAGERATSGFGKIVGWTTRVGTKATVFLYLAEIGITAGIAGKAYIQSEQNKAISASYCGDFTGSRIEGGDSRKGCSIITAVDYNKVEEINRICSGGILGNV